MKDNSLEIKRIKQNLSGIRDIEIRKKAGLMLAILSVKNIRLGCMACVPKLSMIGAKD